MRNTIKRILREQSEKPELNPKKVKMLKKMFIGKTFGKYDSYGTWQHYRIIDVAQDQGDRIYWLVTEQVYLGGGKPDYESITDICDKAFKYLNIPSDDLIPMEYRHFQAHYREELGLQEDYQMPELTPMKVKALKKLLVGKTMNVHLEPKKFKKIVDVVQDPNDGIYWVIGHTIYVAGGPTPKCDFENFRPIRRIAEKYLNIDRGDIYYQEIQEMKDEYKEVLGLQEGVKITKRKKEQMMLEALAKAITGKTFDVPMTGYGGREFVVVVNTEMEQTKSGPRLDIYVKRTDDGHRAALVILKEFRGYLIEKFSRYFPLTSNLFRIYLSEQDHGYEQYRRYPNAG